MTGLVVGPSKRVEWHSSARLHADSDRCVRIHELLWSSLKKKSVTTCDPMRPWLPAVSQTRLWQHWKRLVHVFEESRKSKVESVAFQLHVYVDIFETLTLLLMRIV